MGRSWMSTGGGLPLRLFSLNLHFIVTVLAVTDAWQIAAVGIKAGSSESEEDQWDLNHTRVMALGVLSLIAMAVEFLMMLKGVTILNTTANLYFLVSHSLGFFFTLWTVVSSWGNQSVICLYVFTCLLPVMVESMALLVTYGKKLRLFIQRNWPYVRQYCVSTIDYYYSCLRYYTSAPT